MASLRVGLIFEVEGDTPESTASLQARTEEIRRLFDCGEVELDECLWKDLAAAMVDVSQILARARARRAE